MQKVKVKGQSVQKIREYTNGQTEVIALPDSLMCWVIKNKIVAAFGKKGNVISNRIHTHMHAQPFNGLFSRTTWVGRYQKDKPFWIVLKQEMMGWQWHQLNHMQIICTSLQTYNHASTSSLHIFLQAGCPSCNPTNSIKALKACYIKQNVVEN